MEWSIENVLTAFGLAGAAGAFLIGVSQYRKSQQWKRAEWVAQEMKDFLGDPLVQAALQMIDWGNRHVRLAPGSEPEAVTNSSVKAALRDHRGGQGFTETEANIRDCFDRFLDGLERFDSYVTTGLVYDDNLRPYLAYWLGHIHAAGADDPSVDRLAQLRSYMKTYGFTGADALVSRLGAGVVRPSTADA